MRYRHFKGGRILAALDASGAEPFPSFAAVVACGGAERAYRIAVCKFEFERLACGAAYFKIPVEPPFGRVADLLRNFCAVIAFFQNLYVSPGKSVLISNAETMQHRLRTGISAIFLNIAVYIVVVFNLKDAAFQASPQA